MSRRPYIDQHIIRDDLRAYGAHKDGYAQHCPNYEVVGMDGRNDWFRWSCRECEKDFISPRSEKRMRYMRCSECDALHFVYKGFFDRDRSPTKPLKPSEVSEPLIRFTAYYKDPDDGATFYGGADYLQDKAEGDFWNVTAAYRMHEDGTETLLAEGESELLSQWATSVEV